ncbi:MAG: nicotinamide mononucleotide transporter [Ruminococcaceae bacterium]|nr:nicotinamide mononucleotide transporter [Oscillospiraceae bacterium]
MRRGKERAVLRKKDIFIIILMVFTAILITIAGVYYQQSFLRILPLYVSLVISLLQTRISRFASLMGGINSLLYGAVYIYYSLYGSAFSALLFSFPIQILTFIRWNKNKWEHSTVLRKMSRKQRVIVLFGFIGALAAMWILLPLIGAKYVFLDSIINLLGILIYFLTMFAFVEYTFLMIINGVISIILYITMLSDSPEIATYLIYSVYSFICIVFAFFQAKRLYDTQQQK